jgi:hypothetical protein
VVTLEGLSSIQAWLPFIFGCLKNQYIHSKTMFTYWVSLFCNGFTLGPMTHATWGSMMNNLGSLCEKVSLITIVLLGNACLWRSRNILT